MSRLAEALAWERSRVDDPADLVMLVTIANCANDDGRDAWPEVRYLMEKCRMKERRTQYVLRRLVAEGEIEIEMNDDGREIVLRGGRRFRPKWFIHVLCVCEWERYQTGWKPANIAVFKQGRPKRKPANSADSRGDETRKKQQGNPQNSTEKPANSDGAYKEGSKKEIVVEQEQGAAPPISAQSQTPEENLGVITKAAHTSIDVLGVGSLSDLTADVKQRCIDDKIAWSPDVVRKAIDSALWQRKNWRRA